MRTKCVPILVALACVVAALAYEGFPRIQSVDPETGKIGDTASAKGENLGKAYVGDLFLTDGTNDTKLDMVSQADGEIKFKIPQKAKPGRYHLMILTPNKASYIEQPVVYTVE
jgi:hypothetical protein